MTEFQILQKPEYLHVALNHLTIYGVMLGALTLLISLVLRSRAAQITALILTLVAGLSAYPVLVSGQRAYKTVRGMADDPGAEWLDEHMDRAEKTIGAFYALAALAVAGLVTPVKWPKTGVPLTALTLAGALACSGLAVYISQAGGRVRHPEFRPGDTPAPSAETQPHAHYEKHPAPSISSNVPPARLARRAMQGSSTLHKVRRRLATKTLSES